MNPELQKIIKEQLDQLPQEVRSVIASPKLHTDVISIGQSAGLHVDQVGALEDEILLVMLGLSDPAEFVPTIMDSLKIPQEKAARITQEAANKIFNPIRERMQRFNEEQDAARPQRISGGTPTPAAVPPSDIRQMPVGQPRVTPPKPSISAVPVPERKPLDAKPINPAPIPTPPPVVPAPMPPKPPAQPHTSPEDPFTTRSVKREEVVDVGIAPAKKEYRGKVDPYREPIE